MTAANAAAVCEAARRLQLGPRLPGLSSVNVTSGALDAMSTKQVVGLAAGLAAAGTVAVLSIDDNIWAEEAPKRSGFKNPHAFSPKLARLVAPLSSLRKLNVVHLPAGRRVAVRAAA